jgi:hypothetical protein
LMVSMTQWQLLACMVLRFKTMKEPNECSVMVSFSAFLSLFFSSFFSWVQRHNCALICVVGAQVLKHETVESPSCVTFFLSIFSETQSFSQDVSFKELKGYLSDI